MNALLSKLSQANHQALSTQEIDTVFAEAQLAQQDRTEQLIRNGTDLQKFDAMESIVAPLIVKYVVPNLTDDAALSTLGVNAAGGQRIKALPVPKRDRYVPYDDELPEPPLRNRTATLVTSSFALLQLLLLYSAYHPNSPPGSWFRTLNNAKPEQFTPHSILSHWILKGGGSTDVPLPLSGSVAFFIPITLIWSIEAHRRGNIGSPWSWYVLKLPNE